MEQAVLGTVAFDLHKRHMDLGDLGPYTTCFHLLLVCLVLHILSQLNSFRYKWSCILLWIYQFSLDLIVFGVLQSHFILFVFHFNYGCVSFLVHRIFPFVNDIVILLTVWFVLLLILFVYEWILQLNLLTFCWRQIALQSVLKRSYRTHFIFFIFLG